MDFRFIYILIGTLIAVSAKADERFEFFNGVRALGMGGTQVATVNDETALLGNPAALGRLRDYFWTLADPEGEIGQETQRVIGADVLAFIDPQETLEKATEMAGYRLYQRGQVFPSFVYTNFGFGLYGSWVTNAITDKPATVMDLYMRNDIAWVMGFNFRFFDGRIKLGFNARAINRVLIDDDAIPVASTGLTVKGLSREGFGVASDVGLIMTAPWQWLPTLAAVYRDVGVTSYTMNDGLLHNNSDNTPPPRTPATLDVGFSVQPIVGRQSRLTIAAEVRDVLIKVEDKDTEDDLSRRLHYGFELNIKDFLFFRAGMNQGYWTAGAEMSMFKYQLQAATYGEEVGTKNAKLEDRRYVGKFSWRF